MGISGFAVILYELYKCVRMKKITTENTLFFELLKAAVWDREVDTALFDSPAFKWPLILNQAANQSVLPLIADKALSLPPHLLPPHETVIKLMLCIKQTEGLNRKLNGLLKKISDIYGEQSIPLVLLKGPGVAANYPHPLRRSPGDLDIYLYGRGDYEKANRWVSANGFKYHVDDLRDGHRAFEMDGFTIENHKYITFFERQKYNRLLERELRKVVDSDGFAKIEIDGTVVKILPPELNAFYVFLHMFFHFIHSGVGFRQVIDWILLLSKYRAQIDEESFTRLVKSFDLLYPMQLFAAAAVKYLGADTAVFPFPLKHDKGYSDRIIHDILEGGNFGFHREGRPGSKWGSLWFSYKAVVKKTVGFIGMAPHYTVIIPAIKFINRIKLLLHR